jgi:hypothetical protein
MNSEGARYAAFISYSSKDVRFAKRLHGWLETYRIPGSLGRFRGPDGGGKRNRIYPVFLDRNELPAGQLGAELEAALRASAALIVVCSRNAAGSVWVDKEAAFFQALGRGDRIFAIVADSAELSVGQTIESLLPPTLRRSGDGRSEILAADARRGFDGFRNAALKVVAGLLGVSQGAVADRDRARRVRRAVLTAAALIVGTGGALAAARLAVEPMIGQQVASATEQNRQAIQAEEGRKREELQRTEAERRRAQAVEDLAARARDLRKNSVGADASDGSLLVLKEVRGILANPDEAPPSLWALVRASMIEEAPPTNFGDQASDPARLDLREERQFVSRAFGVSAERAQELWAIDHAGDPAAFRKSPIVWPVTEPEWRHPNTPADNRLECRELGSDIEYVITSGGRPVLEMRVLRGFSSLRCTPVFYSRTGRYAAMRVNGSILLFDAAAGEYLGMIAPDSWFLTAMFARSVGYRYPSGEVTYPPQQYGYFSIVIDEDSKALLINFAALSFTDDDPGGTRRITGFQYGSNVASFRQWTGVTFSELARLRCAAKVRVHPNVTDACVTWGPQR